MWQALIDPIAKFGTQFLAVRQASKDNAYKLAQSKIDKNANKERRADELLEATHKARVNRIENEQQLATSLDAAQLKENREGYFDEIFIWITILAPFVVTMVYGVMDDGAKGMWSAFQSAPKEFWYAFAAVLGVRILAMRAMIRWAIRLWLSMKGGNMSLPGEGKARDSKGKEKAVTSSRDEEELDKPEDILAAKRKDEQ